MPRSRADIVFGPIYRGLQPHHTPQGRSYNLTNVYRTRDGTIRKRPGYGLFKDFNDSNFIHLNWANELNHSGGVLVGRDVIGSNLRIDWLALDGAVTNIINGTDANLPNGTVPSAIGLNADRVALAAGGNILDIGGIPSGPSTTVLTNGPSTARFFHGLTYARGYLMAVQNNTGLTYFNNNAAGNYNISADWRTYNNTRKPDHLVAIFNVRDEILNLGRNSIEFAWLDGVTPWAEVDRSYIPYGIHKDNIYAPVQLGDDVYFPAYIDQESKIVRVHGADHSLEIISDAIDQTFLTNTNLPVITDGTFELYIPEIRGAGFVFDDPYYFVSDWGENNRISLVYNTARKEWFRWGAWNGSIYTELPLRHWSMPLFDSSMTPLLELGGPYILASDNSQNARIYALSHGYMSDDGVPIRCEIEVRNIRHGTGNEKRNELYRIWLKGQSGDSLTVEFDDENKGYVAAETITVNASPYEPIELNACGIYRDRAIRIVHSSSTNAFEFIRMEEEFTDLGR